MTKLEAEQELQSLEEKERIAWAACNAKLSERDVFEKMWLNEYAKVRERWIPLSERKQELQAFIKIA